MFTADWYAFQYFGRILENFVRLGKTNPDKLIFSLLMLKSGEGYCCNAVLEYEPCRKINIRFIGYLTIIQNLVKRRIGGYKFKITPLQQRNKQIAFDMIG